MVLHVCRGQRWWIGFACLERAGRAKNWTDSLSLIQTALLNSRKQCAKTDVGPPVSSQCNSYLGYHKEHHISISLEHLKRYYTEGDVCLRRIVPALRQGVTILNPQKNQQACNGGTPLHIDWRNSIRKHPLLKWCWLCSLTSRNPASGLQNNVMRKSVQTVTANRFKPAYQYQE
jgi:hypothetical protein